MLRGIALIAMVSLLLAACGGGDGETGATGSKQPTGTAEGGTTGGTGTDDDPQPTPRCVVEAGTVRGYVPVIERDACDPRTLLRGAALFDADQVTTGSRGQLQFQAGRLDLCTALPGTELVIRPDQETLVRLISGTVACSAQPGGVPVRLEGPGAEIEVRGTLFTLVASGDETTIKVHEGTIAVRSATDPTADAEEIEGGQQRVAAAGQALRVVGYGVDAVEFEVLTALRLRVISLPPEALPEFTAAGEVNLVTETDGQAELLSSRGVVSGAKPVTTSSLRQRSAGGLGLSGQTVVGVGSFSALAAAFTQLRQALGPGATLVYTPYSFPEEGTETTTTETGETGETTETGTTSDTTVTDTTATAPG